MKEKKAKKKKGLRERKKPDVKGIVDVKVGNLTFDSDAVPREEKKEIPVLNAKDEFNFDPKKVKITKKILNSKADDEDEKDEPLLSDKFLSRWRNSFQFEKDN